MKKDTRPECAGLCEPPGRLPCPWGTLSPAVSQPSLGKLRLVGQGDLSAQGQGLGLQGIPPSLGSRPGPTVKAGPKPRPDQGFSWACLWAPWAAPRRQSPQSPQSGSGSPPSVPALEVPGLWLPPDPVPICRPGGQPSCSPGALGLSHALPTLPRGSDTWGCHSCLRPPRLLPARWLCLFRVPGPLPEGDVRGASPISTPGAAWISTVRIDALPSPHIRAPRTASGGVPRPETKVTQPRPSVGGTSRSPKGADEASMTEILASSCGLGWRRS